MFFRLEISCCAWRKEGKRKKPLSVNPKVVQQSKIAKRGSEGEIEPRGKKLFHRISQFH